MCKLLIFLCGFLGGFTLASGELWEEDLTSAMKIGPSTRGYKSLDLRCDASYFSVNVTLEGDFQGVVYTRGSFHEKKLPCFKRHDQITHREGDWIVIGLRIPYAKCRTVMDVAESRYTNTLVVQHDPDLIMPGDAAFDLDCAFVPEFKETSDSDAKELPFKSKVTLVDADPSPNKPTPEPNVNMVAVSKSEKVTFVPNEKETKDEL